MTWPRARGAGVLLHPTSLPGPEGIGTAGREARAFVDWLAEAGFSVWQILPLGPPGFGNSPYGSLSSFAGHPLLIDARDLVEDGWLDSGSLDELPGFPEGDLEIEPVRSWKLPLLRSAWRRLRHTKDREVTAFAERHAAWLGDWALFRALKDEHRGLSWTRWPEGPRDRHREALEEAREHLADAIGYHRFVQFLFRRQWGRLRDHARDRGVEILGDVPIYTPLDSADVWAHREFFRLDPRGRPEAVAGVPPDYFSETGQRWGNPLYRWGRLARSGFSWWIDRLAANLDLADALRLDHFRGFASYWEIPADEDTAVHGRWVEGPGRALFDAVRERLGDLPFVAEDLGLITEDVDELRDALGLPGMKVAQFGFDEADSIHRFDRVPERDVIYTGTHDNDTTRGWFEGLDDDARRGVLDVLDTDAEGVVDAMIEAVLGSDARLAVLPVQDLLGLGSEARMNTPGVETGNWRWRLAPGALDRTLAARTRERLRASGRRVD